jgi:transcriptional regulator with XRE-family HTH domain
VIDRFGEKVRILRKRHSMTLTQLAEALGYTAHSNSYLSLIEQGKKKPTAEMILKIAKLFGVSTDQLMDDSLEIPEPPSTDES